MLKLLALSDRYNHVRGAKEARHDREEAQTHAADIVAILTAVPDTSAFHAQFIGQFQHDPMLGLHVVSILRNFFREITSPGLLVYSEHVAANLPADRETPAVVRAETELAHPTATQLFSLPEFYAVAAAIDDSTHHSHGAPLVDEYLSTLENARIPVSDALALQSLPSGAFSGAYAPGGKFVMSASEPIAKLSQPERDLLRAYLESKVNLLRDSELLCNKYPHTLKQ
jgi:hypothetical protein